MADLKQLIDEVARVADTAALVLPGAAIAGGAARIGGQLLSIIDDLGHHAPDPESYAKLEEAYKTLMATTVAKSGAISQRLRGG